MARNGHIDIRRAAERFHTRADWLDSWHSFSFNNHYDPENTGHGLLLVSNDDVIGAGVGFGWHPHQDMEIVTWVLEGALAHQDSTGQSGIIRPGLVQRMTAGTGITHTEKNPSDTENVHSLQMWVPPDTIGLEPSYEQRDLSGPLSRGGLVPVASGRGHQEALRIHQKDAVLWIGRLRPQESVQVPPSPYGHVFVARGSVELETGEVLDSGDAARLVNAGELSVKAGPDGSEVVVWEMHAERRAP